MDKRRGTSSRNSDVKQLRRRNRKIVTPKSKSKSFQFLHYEVINDRNKVTQISKCLENLLNQQYRGAFNSLRCVDVDFNMDDLSNFLMPPGNSHIPTTKRFRLRNRRPTRGSDPVNLSKIANKLYKRQRSKRRVSSLLLGSQSYKYLNPKPNIASQMAGTLTKVYFKVTKDALSVLKSQYLSTNILILSFNQNCRYEQACKALSRYNPCVRTFRHWKLREKWTQHIQKLLWTTHYALSLIHI